MNQRRLADDEKLLTPAEVAHLFRVDPKTVARWAKQHGLDGKPKLPSIRTVGGHRRYRQVDVYALLGRTQPWRTT